MSQSIRGRRKKEKTFDKQTETVQVKRSLIKRNKEEKRERERERVRVNE